MQHQPIFCHIPLPTHTRVHFYTSDHAKREMRLIIKQMSHLIYGAWMSKCTYANRVAHTHSKESLRKKRKKVWTDSEAAM